jgi:hypothetical protein
MGSISIHDAARVIDYPEEIHDPRRTEYGNIRRKLVVRRISSKVFWNFREGRPGSNQIPNSPCFRAVP